MFFRDTMGRQEIPMSCHFENDHSCSHIRFPAPQAPEKFAQKKRQFTSCTVASSQCESQDDCLKIAVGTSVLEASITIDKVVVVLHSRLVGAAKFAPGPKVESISSFKARPQIEIHRWIRERLSVRALYMHVVSHR